MIPQKWLTATMRLIADEDGPTAVEYAVLLALITATCVGAISLLADSTVKSFETSGEAINGAFNP